MLGSPKETADRMKTQRFVPPANSMKGNGVIKAPPAVSIDLKNLLSGVNTFASRPV